MAKAMQQQNKQHFSEVTKKNGAHLAAVPRKSANMAFAEFVDRESELPFLQRLKKEYIGQYGHMWPEVDAMIVLLEKAYEKKANGKCGGAEVFNPYSDYVRDELYKGTKKFTQMGKRESELMFIGAMIDILKTDHVEQLVFIRLWNARHQRKFWVEVPGTE